jgi:quinol monooxygenase YgiN
MYGLIGKMRAAAGQRDALIDLMVQGTTDMPGCLSYIVARDPSDPDTIWITEVWTDEASHQASLAIPEVRATIERAMPLIASFEPGTVTEPVGGVGLTGT